MSNQPTSHAQTCHNIVRNAIEKNHIVDPPAAKKARLE